MWQAIRVFGAAAYEAQNFHHSAVRLRQSESFQEVAAFIEKDARLYRPDFCNLQSIKARLARMLSAYSLVDPLASVETAADVIVRASHSCWLLGGAETDVYDPVFKAVEGFLAIGRQAPPLEVPAFQQAVAKFGLAREGA
jgi:hypothetical protein